MLHPIMEAKPKIANPLALDRSALNIGQITP
jgi:hypothetical protein